MRLSSALFMAAIFVVTSASCSAHQSKEAEFPIEEDYFSAQNRCYDAWGELMREWVSVGGGMKSSIQETRQFVRSDSRSQLSRIIRRTWVSDVWRQRPEQWPNVRATSLAFQDGLRGEVPDGCRSIVWLEPLLTEQIVSEHTRSALTASAPPDVRDEGRAFSRWLVYMMLRGTRIGDGD